MKRLLPLLVLLICFFNAKGQYLGTQGVFKFKNLSPTARLTGLGGTNISLADKDGSLSISNPAVNSISAKNHISVQQRFYFSSIKSSFASYTFKLKKFEKLNFFSSIYHFDYGDFVLTDELSNKQGNFDASETAFTLGASYQVYEQLRVGANLSYVTSNFESYSSNGALLDLGGFYEIKDKKMGIGLVFKNIGAQFSKYDDTTEKINPDVQIGISKRLNHLPLSFSVTYHHLNKWNLLYDDPSLEDDFIFLDEAPKDTKVKDFIDNTFRHFIFAGEFLIGKKEGLKLRMSYNHLKRSELSVSNYRSLAGFAGGVGIRIKKLYIDYSFSTYHNVGSSQHIGISTNLNDWKKNNTLGL